MTAHIDADGLAEYSAGLVAGRPRRAIAAHLAGCAECGARAAQLAEVSVLLAAAPLPPVPDALIQRLDLALAAEYSERPVVPVPQTRLARLRDGVRSGARGGGLLRGGVLRGGVLRGGVLREGVLVRGGAWLSGSSRGGSSRGGWSWRLLAPVTAVAVLAAGGYGLSTLGSGPGAGPAVSGAGDFAGGSGGLRAAGNASRVPMATAAPREHLFAPAEPGGKLSVVDSGNDYQPATLVAELSAQLHAGLTGAQATAGVAACVVRVAAGAHPVLVERAKYLGAPVLVVVVPTSPSGHSYQARLAGSACSATDSDIVAEAVLPAGISAP
jgi:hypothetical protein